MMMRFTASMAARRSCEVPNFLAAPSFANLESSATLPTNHDYDTTRRAFGENQFTNVTVNAVV